MVTQKRGGGVVTRKAIGHVFTWRCCHCNTIVALPPKQKKSHFSNSGAVQSADTEESVDSFHILNDFVCGRAYAAILFERNVTHLKNQIDDL